MNVKHLFLQCLLLLAFLRQPVGAQSIVPFNAPDPTERKLPMEGRIKATLRYGYLKDNPEAESLRERVEYNRQGMPVTHYHFSTAGGVERKVTYLYDKTGLMVQEATFERMNAGGDLEESLYYRFDPKGNLLEYHRESLKEGYSGQGNTYDPDGRLLVKQFFEKDRLPGAAEFYGYDAQGRCISISHRDISGETVLLIQNAYDSQGRLEKETHLYQGRMLLYTFQYRYDAQSRIVRKEKLDRSNEVGTWESFTYNAKGLVTEHQTLEQGESTPIIEKSIYDQAGRISEMKVIDTDGEVFQWYKYLHDSTGRGAGFEKIRSDGSPSMENLTVYDTKGRKLESRQIFHDGSGSSRTEYRYDGYGLIMEEKQTATGQEQAVFWFVHERY